MAICLAAPTGIPAEVLQLKDGTLLEGRIVGQDQKRVILKTDAGQRVVPKTSIRRIVYDPGMGARLLGAEKRKREAALEAERRKALEAQRAKEAAELAKKQAQEAALKAEADRIAAAEARRKYLALVEDYRRREKIEAERRAREEALKKEQEKQQPEQKEVAKKEETPVQIDRWGALWRSAILPGWGQFYAGSPISGTAYTGLFTFAAVNSYNLRRIALSSRNDYTNFTDTSFLVPLLPGAGIPAATVVYFETSRRSETYARNVKRQQQSIQFLGGIYLVQLIHAAFLSTEIDATTFLRPDAEQDATGVSLFADQTPIDERDQYLGAGRDGLDSRLGFGYSLRF
ncbi:MAG: hypothetical protein NXI24_03015 [bacterium]|nr:hypothetical protein [bacterium]